MTQDNTIKTRKQAREYAYECFQTLKLKPTSTTVLLFMIDKWSCKYGYTRGINSIARVLGISNDTCSKAIAELVDRGALIVLVEGVGRKASTYDFGPNHEDVLHPENQDESNSENQDTKSRLYPENQDAFTYIGENDDWFDFEPCHEWEVN